MLPRIVCQIVGSVLSPVLANVALHGLETAIRVAFPHRRPGTRVPWKPVVIRYADDFVVLHDDLAVIERAQQLAGGWLAGMGLELKPSKTRITHTLHAHAGAVGFDFLGFTVRQHPVGKAHTGTTGLGVPLGFKTIITPSRTAQRRHYAALAEVIARHRQSTQRDLVALLNPRIVGWANYYSAKVSKRVFGRLDALVYRKLKRWAERRHQKKSRTWAASRYWHTRAGRHWVFGPADGPALVRHADTPIRRHSKVKGDASPFGGDVVYWASRLGRHPELSVGRALLLRRQRGRCAWCGRLFLNLEEVIEVDHRLPRALGGQHGHRNRQLLHGHCHDQKTAADGSNRRRASEVPMSRAKNNPAEEPYEPKGSRTVL